ncbi:MAG: ribose-5-phosphate isomerase RpiA [Acidobacteria bacterium]|jgi:ribose 5-phosphate isomerase A|nr:MAG: ribose-5-phosphate isomerase RpiA [Acidobacteriota bacterium]
MTLSGAQNKSKEQLQAEKRTVAEAALRWVKSGMRLGLGSGSTAHLFIQLVGERVRHGSLKVEGIPTSRDSEALAKKCGIPLLEPERGLVLDLDVDGADEIGPNLDLIKGGGGALLREKAVAHASKHFLVIADSSKQVAKLGAFPLPVEVVPFTVPWVMDEVERLGGRPVLRTQSGTSNAYVTDQQNYILDCHFGLIEDPSTLSRHLQEIPGVAEHGLFLGYAKTALIADDSEVTVFSIGQPPARLPELRDTL